MPTVYYTLDNDAGYITAEADIFRAASMEEARAALLRSYDPADWNHETAVIEAGYYGDCWSKCLDKPRVASRHYRPFTYTQLAIQEPGSHPGGKMYWVTPRPDVYVMSFIEERE